MSDPTLSEMIAAMRDIAGKDLLPRPAMTLRWAATLEKLEPLVKAAERCGTIASNGDNLMSDLRTASEQMLAEALALFAAKEEGRA